MNYLQSPEYETYGVPSITDAVVSQACSVVDAYLNRPEGILYSDDSTGNPLFMSRKFPEGSFTLQVDITPGTNVVATISRGPILGVGSSLVLDRKNSAAETVYVTQVTNATTVTLASVLNAHVSGATAESGMCIENTLNVPKSRYFVTLPQGPIRRVVAAVGRVGYSRRGEAQGMLSPQTYGLLTSLQQFGGAPIWQIIQFMPNDIELEKNQLWTPMGILMTPYSEVRVSYIAGFSLRNLPVAIKQATAILARAINESPAGSSISSFKAGEVQMDRFLSSVLDDDLRSMLNPYRAAFYG